MFNFLKNISDKWMVSEPHFLRKDNPITRTFQHSQLDSFAMVHLNLIKQELTKLN